MSTDHCDEDVTMRTENAELLYPEVDALALGAYYLRHVGAMTRENLRAKSDIACQLAWRDREIDRLTRERDDALSALELIRHATAPSHDDGAYHENAHSLAVEALAKGERS